MSGTQMSSRLTRPSSSLWFSAVACREQRITSRPSDTGKKRPLMYSFKSYWNYRAILCGSCFPVSVHAGKSGHRLWL
jgi:hypothetical protein